MLEIVFIILLFKQMGSILRDKGWKRTGWMQFLVVPVYLGSMIVAMAAYQVAVYKKGGAEAVERLGLELYIVSYLGVIVGVGGLFLCAKILPRKLPASELLTKDTEQGPSVYRR